MRVGPPRTDRERARALACLLGVERLGSTERVAEALSLAESGAIDLSGLVAVWKDREPVAAALWCRAADGSAFVWPPEVRANGHPTDAASSLAEVVARARAAGCKFAQSAVEPDRPDHCLALESAGFSHLTDLLYLKRYVREPLRAVCDVRGRMISLAESSHERFADVIERTYLGSRDCPAFAGFRSAADALRSYEGAGCFTPERWRLVEQDRRDVAVILVNDHEDDAREIVYLGVAPEARRQGLGRSLILAELTDARRDGLAALRTTVDVGNFPAFTLYSRLGFFPGERRSIYLIRLV